MLASRKMLSELNSVLRDVVKVINYIKAHALNSCMFEQICKVGGEHRRLLLYTEMRWLTRRKSLTKVYSNYESHYKNFSRAGSHHWQYILVTRFGSQNMHTSVIYSDCSMN